MSDYIKGIDVSNNNGTIDFSGMSADGVEIVYVKASEGQSFQDLTMKTFYNDCKALGLKVGAYHFLVGTSAPEAQAQNFYSMIKDYTWDCVPMMDVETNFDGLADYVVRFIAEFKSLSPLTLGIYSYTSFLDSIADAETTIKDMPFWEANYNNDPWNLATNFFTNRIGHQYTESGIISGITNEGCDIDSFTNGVYLDSAAKSGEWVQDATGWYYKYADGSYPKLQWLEIDSKWYYFDPSGYSYTGWIKLDNKWYYLDSKGAMLTGWVWVDSACYCLDEHGVLYVDCTTPDGYKVDSSGAWIQ